MRNIVVAFLIAFAGGAAAQYPAKPVRMLVGFAPGGGADITARLVAQKLSDLWGKPVIVENRPGAGGNIATEVLAKSAPDGTTLLLAFSSHASNPALYPNLSFDINRDFSNISLVARAPVTIAVHSGVPVQTLAQFIEYARARPGQVKFASSGIGTPVHLAGELMMQLTGIQMTHVPYKGIAPAMAAMLGGETELTFPAVISGLAHYKSGRLKALAVASGKRFPTLPDVPTAAEAGLSGFEIDYWYAVLGPAGIPRPTVAKISGDIAATMTAPEAKASLLAQGSIAVGGGPEELTALIRSEYALWSRVVRERNVKLE